ARGCLNHLQVSQIVEDASLDLPAYCSSIGLSDTPITSRNGRHFKPRMVCQKLYEFLTHHPRSPEDYGLLLRRYRCVFPLLEYFSQSLTLLASQRTDALRNSRPEYVSIVFETCAWEFLLSLRPL